MSIELSGTWHNQHGSELQIQVDIEGHLRGTFTSGVGFPQSGERFAVSGFAAGDLVGFSVNFDRYDSLTAWSGHYGIIDGAETMYLLWHMGVRLPAGARSGQLWPGIWSGADTFVRGAARLPARTPTQAPSHPTGLQGRSGEQGVITKP